MIAGNVGKDAILGQAGSYAVLNFAVASSKKIKGEDKTTWFDCALFGQRATGLAQYIKKGNKIVVSGECSLEEYQKNDGSMGAKIKVNVTDVKLMDEAPKQQNQQANQQFQQQQAPPQQPQQGYQPQRPQAPQQPSQNQQQPNPNAQQPTGFDEFEDDKLPF